jgi:hypothetical protein
MADRRRGGRKNAKVNYTFPTISSYYNFQDEPQSDKMSKETEAIAKFVRFNCPNKLAMFEGNEVHYFTGNIPV